MFGSRVFKCPASHRHDEDFGKKKKTLRKDTAGSAAESKQGVAAHSSGDMGQEYGSVTQRPVLWRGVWHCATQQMSESLLRFSIPCRIWCVTYITIAHADTLPCAGSPFGRDQQLQRAASRKRSLLQQSLSSMDLHLATG
ncbi:hypothetical protein JZ751_001623 [Albula glossodonta]|uniref:Uncharacterized protein n=1 Tax=Albula glossodonta TaxID=121402 RepID=A0A8T2PU72_9TELE|nr:hypothetical protein JZ751_001623 [Albula glossodonta]